MAGLTGVTQRRLFSEGSRRSKISLSLSLSLSLSPSLPLSLSLGPKNDTKKKLQTNLRARKIASISCLSEVCVNERGIFGGYRDTKKGQILVWMLLCCCCCCNCCCCCCCFAILLISVMYQACPRVLLSEKNTLLSPSRNSFRDRQQQHETPLSSIATATTTAAAAAVTADSPAIYWVGRKSRHT